MDVPSAEKDMRETAANNGEKPPIRVSFEKRYRALFNGCHDGVWVADGGGRLLDVNPALVQLLDDRPERLLELNAAKFFAEAGDWQRLCDQVDDEGSVRDAEHRLRLRDGRELLALISVTGEPGTEGEAGTYQCIVRDVTDRRHAEERLHHAALHDGLTQLPNRTFFIERAGRLLDRLQFQPGARFAILFVDLDRFKLVNDSLGHRWGDELLVVVGERLSHLVRPEDIVARLGGDEFAILLLDVPGPEEAEMLASRIHEGLAEPFDVLGHPIYVSASVGIVLSTSDYRSPEDMIRDADTAMYVAKGAGGRGWAVFDEVMHERVVARLTTETALQRALEREELFIQYQPLISMGTRDLTGFEALLRWRHPERGVLPPAEFLPVAEESGLIVPIGSWVLREVCAVAAAWRQEVDDVPMMAVNVSPQQLRVPGLAAELRGLLETFELPGAALRIEITENALVERTAGLDQTMAEIEALGIDLCLDDFGTRYSTLAYLRDLPIRTIKIDRSFVSKVTREGGTEMVETILELARRLGILTVVEGWRRRTRPPISAASGAMPPRASSSPRP